MARIEPITKKARYELHNERNEKIGISDSLEQLAYSIGYINFIDSYNNIPQQHYKIIDNKLGKEVYRY